MHPKAFSKRKKNGKKKIKPIGEAAVIVIAVGRNISDRWRSTRFRDGRRRRQLGYVEKRITKE
jgi:hypothetical protein